MVAGPSVRRLVGRSVRQSFRKSVCWAVRLGLLILAVERYSIFYREGPIYPICHH